MLCQRCQSGLRPALFKASLRITQDQARQIQNASSSLPHRSTSAHRAGSRRLLASRPWLEGRQLVAGRRGMSNGSSEGGGGEREGTPMAGSYRSPWTIIKEELKGSLVGENLQEAVPVPREVDVLVVGGGAMGSSVAYWLKQTNPKRLNVAVVERDPTYTQASSMLSCGGIRHQFSLEENIQLSLFTSDFLRNIRDHLSVLDDDPPDVQFNHQGYLFLATARSAPLMEKNVQLQRKLGAKIDLMSKDQLAAKFPWLNTAGIEVGSQGLEGEGWFDPWLLVSALKQKNLSIGVKYVHGELTDFEVETIEDHTHDNPQKRLYGAKIRTNDGLVHSCRFAIVVNCAGAWAGDVARKASIGSEDNFELSTPLPVEPRKRFVYLIHHPKGAMLDLPFVVDPCGVYIRREGYFGHYICGASPEEDQEPSVENLDIDYNYFQDRVWPALANRIPDFEALKLKGAWAGYYDYNYVDQNLIIGNHPYHRNFFFANGLSGHGIQHSVAVGRAVSELIVEGKFETIDLSRFSFERLYTEQLLTEENIV